MLWLHYRQRSWLQALHRMLVVEQHNQTPYSRQSLFSGADIRESRTIRPRSRFVSLNGIASAQPAAPLLPPRRPRPQTRAEHDDPDHSLRLDETATVDLSSPSASGSPQIRTSTAAVRSTSGVGTAPEAVHAAPVTSSPGAFPFEALSSFEEPSGPQSPTVGSYCLHLHV